MNAVLAQLHKDHIERRRRMGAFVQAKVPVLVALPPPPRPVIRPVRILFPRGGHQANAHVKQYDAYISQVIANHRSMTTPSLSLIMNITAEHFETEVSMLISDRCFVGLIKARHVAMWICRHLTGASFPKIARHFGDRDHTAVMFAVHKIERLRYDPSFAEPIAAIEDDVSREMRCLRHAAFLLISASALHLIAAE